MVLGFGIFGCVASTQAWQEDIEGRSFQQYLTYHFNYWMTAGADQMLHFLEGTPKSERTRVGEKVRRTSRRERTRRDDLQ